MTLSPSCKKGTFLAHFQCTRSANIKILVLPPDVDEKILSLHLEWKSVQFKNELIIILILQIIIHTQGHSKVELPTSSCCMVATTK